MAKETAIRATAVFNQGEPGWRLAGSDRGRTANDYLFVVTEKIGYKDDFFGQ